MNRKFSRIIDSLPLGILPFTLVMLLVLQFGIPPLALPQQETAPPPSAKQILVLYTYAGGITVNQKATGAFFSVLTSRGFNNDDVFLEYLDLQRNNSPAYRRRVANLLLDKYGKRDIGLIVTVHTWALEFLLEECKGLFPDVPIFSFLVARPELIKAKNTGRRILLRPQNMDMGGTLEIALKMFPETRKVVSWPELHLWINALKMRHGIFLSPGVGKWKLSTPAIVLTRKCCNWSRPSHAGQL
jgi:hypothetical protein